MAMLEILWFYPAIVMPATETGKSEGIELPVRWGKLGVEMIETGIIDKQKLESLYADREKIGADERKLIENLDNGNLKITPENSRLLLTMLWALGLGNKNDILEQGPMMDMRYGGPERFASTGGWTLTRGDAMDHYSMHRLLVLTPTQQALTERASKNIYRPCCKNPAYFPDCNHGMAMLGLVELMAANNVSEQEIYRVADAVNALWFPGASQASTKGCDV